jgi:hypothetical protein
MEREIGLRRQRMFKKKKAVKTGRIFYIPDEHMEYMAKLVTENDREKTKLSCYRLWKFIFDIIPETKDGQWTLHTGNSIKYYVEENL